jgi:hypothetical protein
MGIDRAASSSSSPDLPVFAFVIYIPVSSLTGFRLFYVAHVDYFI